MRTVRRSLRPDCFRMRIASIITAEPAALSVAPVPRVPRVEVRAEHHDLVGLVGARDLADDVERRRVVVNVFLMSRSILTGMFFSSVRTIRP